MRVHRHLEEAVGGAIKIGGLSAYDPTDDFSWLHASEFPLIIVDVAVGGEVPESQAKALAGIQRRHKGGLLRDCVAGAWMLTR
jgi:hypothetical protein